MDKKEDRPEVNKNALIFGAIAFIVVALLVLVGSLGSSEKPNVSADSAPSISAEDKNAAAITQEDAENFCQDAGLLGKYIDLDKIDVVTFSYNPQFTDLGTYDEAGNRIYSLQWTGRNNDTDNNEMFICDISGTKDNISLHYLRAGEHDLYGKIDYQTYDKNGKASQE